MLYPVRFVEWSDVVEWSWHLSDKILKSGFKPNTIIAVGRGGLITARLLCDVLEVEKLLVIPVRWMEIVKKPGEKYLADLIRAWIRASREGVNLEESINDVVRRLRISMDFNYDVDLSGLKALLIEEIIVTGLHMKTAMEVVVEKWRASEVKCATLIWKSAGSAVKPDYYVIETKEFTWFQFPWSRLDDYKQFIRVMLIETLRGEGKAKWSMSELKSKFEEWYGSSPDPRYLRRAIDLLAIDGLLKLISPEEFEVISTEC